MPLGIVHAGGGGHGAIGEETCPAARAAAAARRDHGRLTCIPAHEIRVRAARRLVREIRMALGLSQSQLAARAGVSRATVQQMERAEAQRRITLASLDKLAHAMGCQVALAIMPKGGTLEDVRRSQAAAKADVLLHEKTKDNKRPPRPVDLERRRQQLITRLLRGSRRRLWKAN